MLDSQVVPVAAGASGLIVTAVLSVPCVSSLLNRLTVRRRQYQSLPAQYEDEDGTATEESTRSFSTIAPRIMTLLLAIAGFSVSLASAVLETISFGKLDYIRRWLGFALWACVLLQAITLFAEPRPTGRFTIGILIALSCFCFFVASGLEILLFKTDTNQIHGLPDYFVFANCGISFASMWAACLIPRRPTVFEDDKPVDGQYQVSFIGKISFSWAAPLLNYAGVNQNLTLENLPTLHFGLRAKTLLYVFEGCHRHFDAVWKMLAYIYRWPLLEVLFWQVTGALLSFTPQMTLFGILRLLEEQSKGVVHPLSIWFLVFSLGGALYVSGACESWVFFIIYSKLGIPIFEQLAIVSFAKSLRRKDVKGTEKSKESQQESEDDDPKSGKNGANAPNDDDEESGQKTRQATINLIAIDAKRLSDFFAALHLFPSIIVKLSTSFAILNSLIGWQSLLSGIAVAVIVTPVNIYCARKYTYAQDVLMKTRDKKMAIVTEVLQGIRQIKFSALERQWENKIANARNTELVAQWKAFVYDGIVIMIWILGPIMLSAVSLGTYSYLHGELSASVAFTTIAIFAALEMSLAILPELIVDSIDAYVSSGRIDKHLKSEDKARNTIDSDKITFEGATISWPRDEDEENPFTLEKVNLNFPPKGLSVISGKTGAGKSLLLAAILGEVDILAGTVHVPAPPALEERFDERATKDNWILDSAVAYAAQLPWIENATIRENITFGLPFDLERYNKVLFACALDKDFGMFTDGDLTDIGANGINLSGGQKWRVSFARALYSRAGIMVLDDLFSALDAHTGRHLYQHALTGELGKGRTRILVTHHVALCLDKTDYSVYLENGTVSHSGSLSELRRTGSLKDILSQKENAQEPAEEFPGEDIEGPEEEAVIERVVSHRNDNQEPRAPAVNDDGGNAPKKFQQEETRATGSIKFSHYKKYFRSAAPVSYWLLIFSVYVTYATFDIGRSWWINLWTRASGEGELAPEEGIHVVTYALPDVKTFGTPHSVWYYLSVYFGLSLASSILGGLRYGLVFVAAIRASRNLFNELTFAVLRAPLRWLDTVPVGRILNRFTSDFNMIDSRLAYDGAFMTYNVFVVLTTTIAGAVVSPTILLFSIIPMFVCYHYSSKFLAGAREVKRLESNAKSPVYEQYGTALTGLGTIRAYSKAQTYIERMYAKVDTHARAFWNLWLFNRWLHFRMVTIGAVFSMVTAAIIVSIKDIDAPLAGFVLSFALRYTSAIGWALRSYANVELNMNAMERVIEYSNIEIETQDGGEPPAAWPTKGHLEIDNLVAAYAHDLEPVLKGLTFSVDPNSRVGVVGRTGAGKSSLTLALFRFIQLRSGCIHIDGIDISKINLHDLRSRLAIIPQDPVLFSGTIRTNLDPFDEFSDNELRDSLERVHLVSAEENTRASTPSAESSAPTAVSQNDTGNANIFCDLSSPIAEGGLNLSQGQRQLLCLARAIVARPKIMVLDEATSAVDMSTDGLIQQSIRAEFGRNSTLLVIAHRLSTIVDFDKILVMDAGKAVEYGAPKDLMGIENGVFRSLVEESGERQVLEGIIFGKKPE